MYRVQGRWSPLEEEISEASIPEGLPFTVWGGGILPQHRNPTFYGLSV